MSLRNKDEVPLKCSAEANKNKNVSVWIWKFVFETFLKLSCFLCCIICESCFPLLWFCPWHHRQSTPHRSKASHSHQQRAHLSILKQRLIFFPLFSISSFICFYTARSKQGAVSLLYTGFLGSYNISETTILWQNQCLQGGAVMCFHHRMVNTKTSGYRRDVGMLLEINIT